ncbi:MAG: DMT family transporter [Candidatus Wallacebacter cryptica]|nr:EamA family transporter [Bacillota bacterium]
MNQQRLKAINQLVLASVLWSSAGVLIKSINLNTMALSSARAGIAVLVLFIYLRRRFTLTKYHLLGALTYAANSFLFVAANKLTTSANAILLQFTAPIWVALFAVWFLKERVRRSDWVSVAVVTIGMVLFFIGDLEVGHLFGNILAVISGIAMAGFVIVAKLDPDRDPAEYVLLGNLVNFLIGLPFLAGSAGGIDLNGGLLLLVLGIFQLGLPYILYTKAIPVVSSLEAILITILEPLLNPVWVAIVTGEKPGIWAVIGGLIVLSTVIIRGVYQAKNADRDSSAN